MNAPASPNALDHQPGQHVECWGYLRTEITHRGIVRGSFWTNDEPGEQPYKCYLVDLADGGEVRVVHEDVYPDHEATRAAIAAWLAGPRPGSADDGEGEL